jgi:diguanylate cyclase (GGDEF)-like protein
MLATSTATCVSAAKATNERLRLLHLDEDGALELGHQLQNIVIRPNVDSIVNRFCETLLEIEQFQHAVPDDTTLHSLKQTLHRYMLSIGIDFRSDAYFEERRQIGIVHQKIGVRQSHYQCAFRRFQDLLITSIPASLRNDQQAYEAMLRFILKITALDISLAVESYCSARLSELAHSLESERGKSARLKKLSVTDRLTDLHNHGYAKHRLEEALQHADDEGLPLSIIMADLDHFKAVNDSYGHLVGDDVLRIAAARMVSAARARDEISRYGGEEFLFILLNTNMAGACEVAERVRSRIARDEIRSGDIGLGVTLSLGVTEARRGDTVDSLIQRADEALYQAKAEGRNCVRAVSDQK